MPRLGSQLPPLTPEQQDLAAGWFPFARKLSRELARARPDLRAEIESAAMLGLCEAARAFDPSLGFAFGSYAKVAIRHRASEAIRTDRPKGYRRDAARAALPVPCHHGSLPDTPEHAPGPYRLAAGRDELDSLRNRCPSGPSLAALDAFLRYEDRGIAAASLGVSRATFNRHLAKAAAISRQSATSTSDHTEGGP
jgi:hypothetical protein